MQNLFDKASLVMVPSGYDNGKLYNIKPEDKSSAFEFERGSVATRVNSEGLIEISGTGKELLDYDTFYYGQGGWSLVDGKWVFDDVTAGHLNVKVNDIINVVVGETYEVIVDVSISSGEANLRFTSGNAQTILFNYKDFPDGVTKFTTTVTGVDGGISRLYSPTSLADGPFTLNSISIKKVYEDTPRIDYTSGEGALLLEPQRTNEYLNSNDFSLWYTDASVTDTANQLTSPDGNINATLMSVTNSGRIYYDPTISTTADRVLSIFIKGGTFNHFRVGLIGSVALVDLVNETSSIGDINSIGNGWYRVSLPPTSVSSTSRRAQIQAYPDNTYTNSHGQSGTYYIYGAQLEQGSYATSYIPTNGQQETRAADLCINAGSADTFNDTEGVLYAEVKFDNEDRYEQISVGSGANNMFVSLGKSDNQGDNAFYIRAYDGTTVQGPNQVLSGYSSLENNKIAFQYGASISDFKIYINGNQVSYNFSGTVPTLSGIDKLSFRQGSVSPTYGTSKMIAYFPETLTDEELQRLTSPSADATTFTELANNNGYTIL